MSRTPEIKMGVLLGSSPADKQVLFTWAFGVVPSGLSLRGPDMSLDMRLFTVSDKTSDSDGSESMGVVLSDPHGLRGATDPTKTTAYVSPPTGGHEVLAARCSVFARDCRQRRGPSAWCWGPIGGFRRVVQTY